MPMLYRQYVTELEILSARLTRARSVKTRQATTDEISRLIDTYHARQQQLNAEFEAAFAANHMTETDRQATQVGYNAMMETDLDTVVLAVEVAPADGLDTDAKEADHD